MKIALIQCPVWGTYDPPLALAQLSACLKKENHEVFCFDINIDLYLKRTENYKNMWAWEQCLFWYSPEQVRKFFSDCHELIEEYVNRIISSNAKIICFSVSASSRLSSIEIANKLKKKKRDLIVIFGGPLFFESKFINTILQGDTVDIVVPGEGELTLCELVKFIEKEKDITYCPGLFFKRKGIIFNSETRPLIKNLDDLPFLDFSDLNLNNYDNATHIPFMASRGCIQQCVFCSSKSFWPGYRCMSGERIYKEIEFHKKKHKIGHVDFLDLLFNGNMKSLISFCNLMIDVNLDIFWTVNMIIRPEMTPEILKRLKKAGCKHIIYGIESGSQHVLNLMRKHYKIEDADKVIRDTHDAGITVTANFMFGFPGETKEDFALTLGFIKRNAKFLDRVYPSRTFCAIEEFSYFSMHLNEFGIKSNAPNHLYWELEDGTNSYPERLRRCEIFCELASSLQIEVGCGVQSSVELDKWYNLGHYFDFKKDYKKAVDCYLRYYELDSSNELITNRLQFYFNEAKSNNSDLNSDEDLMYRLKKAVFSRNLISKGIMKAPFEEIKRLGRDRSFALSKLEITNNSQLNEDEYKAKKLILKSYPKVYILQVPGPYISNCIFSPERREYDFFNLEIFRNRFEEKIMYYFTKAERLALIGPGEFLLLSEAKDILDYFDRTFPYVEKIIYTDGSGLNSDICEKLIECNSRHRINISLNASNSKLHKLLTRTDNFHKILGQLNYLRKIRNDSKNTLINLIFIATTLNIEDLPYFIVLASRLGIDKVICQYNNIYISAQKYLSCFFKQELTNQVFAEAEKIAYQLGLALELPPKFGIDNYPNLTACRLPWSQVIFDIKGKASPCDSLLDEEDKTLQGKWFNDIWNGLYYQSLRESLIDGTGPCFKYCFHANPRAVNDFRSHVLTQGKGKSGIENIDILWKDNF